LALDVVFMLEQLLRIVQEVNEAPDLEKALAIIVRSVKKAVGADVCSVYLTDFDKREHVLQATDGLNPSAVGKVRLPLNRGLIGLVSERAEPVNLDDASTHPRYLFITETGEKRYRGFLGAPIIQNRRVLGVLVLRKREARRFGDDEVTLVMTIASQLAGAITHARASGELARLQGVEDLPSRFLQGLGASPGIAAVVREVDQLATRSGRTLKPEDRALFDAWRLMLESDTLLDGTLERIRAGQWAPAALRDVIADHAGVFEAMDDPYLRERASDVRDLGRRILTHLQNVEPKTLDYGPQTILVGEEISAIQLAAVPPACLAGVISATGSSFSHVAILARGLGVPVVMGVADLPVGRLEGKEVVVDGYRGRIYLAPGPVVRAEYQRLRDDDRALTDELESLRPLPSETLDGYSIPLFLNAGLVSESRPLSNEQSDGVGLYRTELPFLVRDRFPGESSQYNNYRQVLETFHPRPVTIRTLDIGGDKPLPYFPIEESNPFLGWRGIRITLDHPDIFLTQVRAMLRANLGLGNLQIMLPMISSVGEVNEAKKLIRRARDELLEEGLEIQSPPIGIMIEVPAAVYQVEALARRVDFLSVGTNDLTQYLLAVDRNNSHVAKLYDELHPAVLRALELVVAGARVHRREVSICGEMAGNPLAVPLLIGMGVHALSMNAGSLVRIKWVVRNFSRAKARELLESARQCEDAGCVRRLMTEALEEAGLIGLVRPGK
jgi:phosphotransferase system enzyme I (PtsP)